MSVKPSEEEEKYFQQVAADERKRMRKDLAEKAAAVAASEKIGEYVGADDAAIIEGIRALGFDDDTARVLDLLPLIHVVWADGSVDRRERARVMNVLVQRGIPEDSQAWLLVESLLEERPSEEFLEETLKVLHAINDKSPSKGDGVVDLCMTVAEASGGFLGLLGDPISREEKEAIAKIASALGETAEKRFRVRFNK